MSALPLSGRSSQLPQMRTQLRSVSLADTRSRKKLKLNTKIVWILTVGALGVAIANLVLHILSSTAVYELANIQQQARELNTTSQIIAGEVGSLSSQQNLANSAQKLGMIANANPVFLSISEQKVYGKPKAALRTDGRLAKNLIANSVMSTVATNLVPEKPAEDGAVAGSAGATSVANVANPKTPTGQVISKGGIIPASPTH